MKAFLFSLMTLFMLTGCNVTYDTTTEGESLYVMGTYGWMIHDVEVAYTYDDCLDETLYFETPYLPRGTKIYIDVYNDYDYAYVEYDSWQISLYDQWFNGDYEAHYTFEVDESGYQYFGLHNLHPESVVHVYYQ